MHIINKITYTIYLFIILSVSLVTVYRYIPPPFTPLMIIRLFEAEGISKSWVNYSTMSKNFPKAFIGGEDGKFMRHNGFDWQSIKTAQRYNTRQKNGKLRGASTISMQTAKNVFLWNGRNFIRKGLEAYFTILIEKIWDKKRILEVYANVVEMGGGIYGVEAASNYYFGKSASEVTRTEASLIAAILPNPRRWSASKPTPYIQKRASWIRGRMGVAIPKE